MRKAFFASTLLLLLACSLSWGASVADLKPLDGTQEAVPMAKPPSGPCTVTCWNDPTITCTSQTGNCTTGGFWGIWWITCDGTYHYCPEF